MEKIMTRGSCDSDIFEDFVNKELKRGWKVKTVSANGDTVVLTK